MFALSPWAFCNPLIVFTEIRLGPYLTTLPVPHISLDVIDLLSRNLEPTVDLVDSVKIEVLVSCPYMPD